MAKWLTALYDDIAYLERSRPSGSKRDARVGAPSDLPVKGREFNALIETFLAMQKGSPIGEMLSEKQGIEGSWSVKAYDQAAPVYYTIERTKG